MKYLLTIWMLCFGITVVSAQEVYNSSGKPGKRKSKESTVKGFDPSRLIFGGGVIASFGTGFTDFGVSPIVGYRFTDRFSAGIGLGYQYLKQTEYVYTSSISAYAPYPSQAHILSPSIWTRVHVFNDIFAEGVFEYNVMYLSDYAIDQNSYEVVPEKITIGVPSLLLGAGIKRPIGGRASFIIEVLYDVLQQDNSPYFGIPVIKGGIVVGL